MRHRLPLLLLLAAGLCLVTLGCPKKKDVPTPTPAPVETPKEAPPAPAPAPPKQEVTEDFPPRTVETTPVPPSAADLNAQGILKTVYFDFDRSDLTDEARRLLQGNAQWLKSNPGHAIRVEGHCDERGTIEYNLALGERRAGAVRDYLTSLGVEASRIRIVTYGEERPVDPGHGEGSWSKNRRAESLFES